MSSTTNYDDVQRIADNDVQTLIKKGETYGDSWKRRGGVGAFMMLARKWDRIENQCAAMKYDVFEAGLAQIELHDSILDDIADLRCYLLLVEAEVVALARAREMEQLDKEMRRYVDQG